MAVIQLWLLSNFASAVAANGASSACAASSEDACSAADRGLPAAAMLQARSVILNDIAQHDSSVITDNAQHEATAAAEAAVTNAVESAAAAARERARTETYLKTKQRRKEYVSHRSLLTRAMAAVNLTDPAANAELDNMMQSFVDNQAASEDKCPAQLLEAKHQLNVIHEHVHELALEVNITEQGLISEHLAIETTYEMFNGTHSWTLEETQKCKAEREENWKMYYILKAELLEMHQIANPTYQASYDYSAWATKHDFSAKTHTIVSTSSFASGATTSTSTGSHSNTATGISSTGYGGGGFGTSGMSTGSGYGSSTGGMSTGLGFGTSGIGTSGTSFGTSGQSTGFNYGGGTGFGGTVVGTSGQSTSFGYGSSASAGGTGFGYSGLAQTGASFLQEDAEADQESANPVKDPARVAKARAMVQQTKKLAAELSACMVEAKRPKEEHAALLEESALPTSKRGGAHTAILEQGRKGGFAYGSSGYGSTGSTGVGSSGFGTSGTSGYGSSSSTGYGSSGYGTSGSTGYGSSGYGTSGSTGYSSGFGSSGYGSTGYGYGGVATSTTTASASTTGSTYHSSSHSSSYHSAVKTSHTASHSSLSKYTTSSTAGTGWGSSPGTSEECQWQKQALQVVYIRAYVELTRLLAQYEVIVHQHTCDDWVSQTSGQQEKILDGKMLKMTTTVSSFQHKLETYRMRLEAAYKLEVQLRSHIQLLIHRCGEMGATVSSLNKVRDAIQIMGVCPGLGRITFNIPKFTGQILHGTFDTLTYTDEEIDAQMNKLCDDNKPSSGWEATLVQTQTNLDIAYAFRAAESSEIMLQAIENMPHTNTASIPLFGSCPNCDGSEDQDDGPQHASGHFRVCWDPAATLDHNTKRRDCSGGPKAVMCVAEQTLNENSAFFGR